MSVDQIMHRDVITLGSDEVVATAVSRMHEHNLGAVLLVDEGKLTGIFSERDLLRRVVAAKRDPATTVVRDVATTELVTVEADAPVRECYQLFKDKGFRHLPIVGADNVPIGIISSRDLLNCMMLEIEPHTDMEVFATIGSMYFNVYGIDDE